MRFVMVGGEYVVNLFLDALYILYFFFILYTVLGMASRWHTDTLWHTLWHTLSRVV